MTNFALMWAIFLFWIVKSSIWGKFEGVCVCEVCEFNSETLHLHNDIEYHTPAGQYLCLSSRTLNANCSPFTVILLCWCIKILHLFVLFIEIKSNQSPQLHINEILY